MYTKIIIKNFTPQIYIKKNVLVNIRIINLSLNELKLVAQNRNIISYESKPKKDLVKALSKPKLKIRKNKKKLKEIRKDFDELRHKFSETKAHKYRRVCYDIENYRHLYTPNIKNFRHISESGVEEVRKNLNKLKTSLKFENFYGNIDSVGYEDLDNYDDNYDFVDDDDEYRKIEIIKTLFKEIDRDYYKPIRTNDGFARRKNN